MPLPDEFLQELKSRCDIGDIASAYVSLRRRGKKSCRVVSLSRGKDPFVQHIPRKTVPFIVSAAGRAAT